jgi:glutamate synthase domain-containing protein 3
MKEYKEKKPVIIIGGRAGSFLGEYQAGGMIVVLNLINPGDKIVGYFPCTGMHGGKMFLRSDCRDVEFPKQVTAKPAEAKDIEEIKEYITEFCRIFGYNVEDVLAGPFTIVTPDSKNPYKQMYVPN